MVPLGKNTPLITIPQDELEEMLNRAAELSHGWACQLVP